MAPGQAVQGERWCRQDRAAELGGWGEGSVLWSSGGQVESWAEEAACGRVQSGESG